MPRQSSLETAFETRWLQLSPDYPPPQREWKFLTGRKFAFDFAWPEYKVAVEMEGGIHGRGRHVRPAGYEKDCEKYNLAALFGWCVLRYTGGMLERDPEKIVGQIQWILEQRGWE